MFLMKFVGTYRCKKLWCSEWAGNIRLEPNTGTKIKITNLNGAQSVPVHAQYVLGFEITVCNTFGVQETQSARHLSHNLSSLRFREIHVLLDTSQ